MKKRLLMQFLALVCAVGAYAYAVGDNVYTTVAKFEVTGANLLENGNFANGYTGWTDENGSDIDTETWSLEVGQGIDGGNAIMSTGAKTSGGTWLHFVQPIATKGTYVFSYWVKAPAAALSAINATPQVGDPDDGGTAAVVGTNAINFFTNTTGDNTIEQQVAGAVSLKTEWTEVVFSFEANAGDYFVFNAAAIASETMFTNFELLPVAEVFDTRITDRLLSYLKGLLAIDGLEGNEQLLDCIAALEEDPTQLSEIEDEVNEGLAEMFNQCAGNLVGTTDNGISTTRYLSDWETFNTYIQYNSLANRGNWTFNGGRWGWAPNVVPGTMVKDADGNDTETELTYLSRPQGDGYVACAGIQRGNDYTLDVSVQITDSALVGTSLKPGRYLFSIEAQAVAAQYSSNSDVAAHGYGSNPGIEIAGPWIWVGKDTLALRPQETIDEAEHPTWRFSDEKAVLNGTTWQRFFTVGEVKEGEDITAGFHFPVVASTGGRYSVRNPQFRLIGTPQSEIDFLYAYDQLNVQRDALKDRLDKANEDNKKTIDDGYPWGHKVLQDSIDKFTKTYNALLKVVDAEGNVKDRSKVTLAYKDEILAAVTSMNSARTNYANTNKVYQQLVADIAYCIETKDAPLYADGDKVTFQSVITKAQETVDNTKTDADEVDKFNAMDDELLTARQDFMMVSGSRANPIDLNYTLKNGGFEAWGTSEPNYTSSTTVNNWYLYAGADIKQWQIRNNDAYESGKSLGAWRGTTVGPNGKAQQTFSLWKKGVYEYRAKAFATDDTYSQYMAMAQVLQNLDVLTFESELCNDTVYYPNIRLFFGPNGNTDDSITIYKASPVVLTYNRYTPRTYSIIYVKADDNPLECELGFEARDNGAAAGANAFGFGDNHLYYLGSEEAYRTATQAAFEEEEAKARALIAKYQDAELKVGDENLKQSLIQGMYRYMGDIASHKLQEVNNMNSKTGKPWIAVPTTLQELQNAIISLQENEALLEELANYVPEDTGISAVELGDNGTGKLRKGVYTVTGVKVNGALKPGLYIINGKKVLVK